MHLKQPGLVLVDIVLVGHLLKIKSEFKNLKKQEIEAIFKKMNLIKRVLNMIDGDFEDLARTTDSDKILRDKAFNIAKNPNYDGYQRGLASMVYKFFDKKSASFTDKSVSGSGIVNNNNNNNNNNMHREIRAFLQNV